MSQYLQTRTQLPLVAAGTEVPGRILPVGGRMGIIGPSADGDTYPAGAPVAVDTDAVVVVDKGAEIFSEGGLVGYTYATDLAAATTLGDYDIGTALADAATGDATVTVILNQGL